MNSRWSSSSMPSLLLLFVTLLPSPLLALNSDGTLLLSFKYAVLNDPLSVLADWNYDDDTPCSWNGVMCMGFANGTNSTTSRVISLVLPSSQLLASVVPELALIDHLRHLDLSGNFLNGTLPASLFNASELRILSLADNEISGDIPYLDVARLVSLQVLNLSDNALTGAVPANLTLLPNLTVAGLANNYLSGALPGGGGFASLQVLDLSSNLVNGSLPPDLAGASLKYLNLSSNRLAGEIPAELGSRLTDNAILDFSFNNLTGGIPQSGAFLSQKTDAFAGNADLCGKPLKNPCTIPSTLSNPPNVTTTGGTGPQVPDSPPAFAAIPKTPEGGSPAGTASAGSPGQGGLRPATIAAITIGDLAGIGLLFVVFLYVYLAKKKKRLNQEQQKQVNQASKQVVRQSASPESRNRGLLWCLRNKGGDGNDTEETSETAGSSETEAEDEEREKKGIEGGEAGKAQTQGKQQGATLVTVDSEVELEMETLLKASAYILGATGSSIVYKAVLADGTALAVRRIGESCSIDKLKDFEAQVRGIAKFRHPNLLRIWGFYWGPDEKLLIHDYAPNGSLGNITFSKKLGSSPFHLSWEARLRIARGVARGLAYIHEKKWVHGNVKPSNVLLGSDMEPRIGDLGLDRLFSGDGTNRPGSSARLFGSKRSVQSQSSVPELSPVPGASPIGSSSAASLPPNPYQAPESLKNLKPSAKWDVYSYGVVLLELISGRVFTEAELAQWNAGFMVEEKNKVLRMADPSMRGEVEGKEEALLGCFKVGFACASMAPQRRPSMRDVLLLLEKIPSTSSASPSFY